MQGGVAQTIGLVLAVNARLRGLPLAAFWPTASIFRSCKCVDFVGRKRRGLLVVERDACLGDPAAWLATTPSSATGARLRLVARNQLYISNRVRVAFANGGPMLLAELQGARPAEAWRGEWRIQDRYNPEKRIWGVTYRNVADAVALEPGEEPTLAMACADIEQAIERSIAFSRKHGMLFDECFGRALARLCSDDPCAGMVHQDMLPDGLMDLDHRRLFGCCAAAWVFGGMGTWNDWGFHGEEQLTYEELSNRLFDAVIQGLAVATNSTGPWARRGEAACGEDPVPFPAGGKGARGGGPRQPSR